MQAGAGRETDPRETTSVFISSLILLMTKLSWGPRELVLTLLKFSFFQMRWNYMVVIHFSEVSKTSCKMEKWPTVFTRCPSLNLKDGKIHADKSA